MSLEIHTILGIRFKVGPGPAVVDEACKGGLIVVPSAPVLVDVAGVPAMREAVLGADMAITDSGLMVLLWRVLKGKKLERVSGLEYLKLLLDRPEVKQSGAVFFVMPGTNARDRNLTWLKTQGFKTTERDCYLAPMYGEGALRDEALLTVLRERRPNHVVLCLGGGVQERLGYYLRNELAKDAGVRVPSIHCIGAAIGFLSGDQVKIPNWVDFFYLGWLWRLASSPRKFWPRYWKALRLFGLMVRYRERVPVPS
ncbi:WecB/TagA/CpsF family glycosyltransferase [Oleiharenicola lentus]|uniref:WecB/TagA/CpsF family glycosyltransferase n=1 Tax=Oleiharenicola lentus TaxID=2508720 RepID=UPI003F679925